MYVYMWYVGNRRILEQALAHFKPSGYFEQAIAYMRMAKYFA